MDLESDMLIMDNRMPYQVTQLEKTGLLARIAWELGITLKAVSFESSDKLEITHTYTDFGKVKVSQENKL